MRERREWRWRALVAAATAWIGCAELAAAETIIDFADRPGWTFAMQPRPAAAQSRPTADTRMTEDEFESLSCAVAGGGAVLTAFGAGGANLIHLIAGGVVPSVNVGALAVALFGVIFGSFCGIAQAAAPATRYVLGVEIAKPEKPADRPVARVEPRALR